jgi:hypothetical protein
MKFQDKFKPGDIICSDRFHNGLCMVVESGKVSPIWGDGEFVYHCQDLVREDQGWIAHEYIKPYWEETPKYNWRLATDDDIANYLSRFVHIQVPKIGNWNVELMDDGIMLDDGGDYSVLLDAEELVQLGKIINERVVG